MFEIVPASPDDDESIRRLQPLSPYPETAATGEVVHFLARSGQAVVGAAGMELLPDGSGLVRMLVVIPGYRKRSIARQLLLRLIALGSERAISDIYVPGLFAGDYFRHFGFAPCSFSDLPPAVSEHPFPGVEKMTGKLMRRSLRTSEDSAGSQVAAAARRHFDSGFLCAESVLAAVAEQLDIHSPFIPAIATGFCNGMAGTWGTCGSISGGVLAINLILGRQDGSAPIAQNNKAVRRLIQEFRIHHGATQCSELIACDLESAEGRRIYRENCLRQQCREYVGTAAAISLKIIDEAKADK